MFHIQDFHRIPVPDSNRIPEYLKRDLGDLPVVPARRKAHIRRKMRLPIWWGRFIEIRFVRVIR